MHLKRVARRGFWIAIESGHAREIGIPVEQIAWLHDVIEDTPYDADHLRREGFSEEVVSGVLWLTRTGNEPYADWIERLCADAPLAVLIVKLADVQDNGDPERLAKLPAETRARLERKYGPARERLEQAIRERTGQ